MSALRLPDFVVIGAMKAGTTSLYHYLRQHPDVFMPQPKEVDFFYERERWERGVGWYASLFAAAGEGCRAGEASPNYAKAHLVPAMPARMAQVIPDARLVYCLRDPIERALSHHVHVLAEAARREEATRGEAPAGLLGSTLAYRKARVVGSKIRSRRRTRTDRVASALLADDNYVLTSSYAYQIERLLEHFPREQLLLVTAEQLRSDPLRTMAEIHRFIGVDPTFVPDSSTEHHRSADKLPGADRIALTEEAVARLAERLAPDVRRLRRYMGPDFDGWGIA